MTGTRYALRLILWAACVARGLPWLAPLFMPPILRRVCREFPDCRPVLDRLNLALVRAVPFRVLRGTRGDGPVLYPPTWAG